MHLKRNLYVYVCTNFHSFEYFKWNQALIFKIRFLVPGDFGNPKQYFNFFLGVQMQEP